MPLIWKSIHYFILSFILIGSLSVSATTTISATNCNEVLQDLSEAYQLGASLFLNSSQTGFQKLESIIPIQQSTSAKVFEATDTQQRSFVFKKRKEAHPALEYEYRMLRRLQRVDEIVPEPYLVKIKTDVYLGTPKVRGINVKELYSRRSVARMHSTKREIERMLGEEFNSEDLAVQKMASILLNHPYYQKKMAKIEHRFTAMRLNVFDFQFMFAYNPKTDELVMQIIDVGEYHFINPKNDTASFKILHFELAKEQLQKAAAGVFTD